MSWNAANDYPVTNIQFFNCIFSGGYTFYKSATTASFINCVMSSPAIIGHSSVNVGDAGVLMKNCIFGASGAANNVNTVFESNFFAEDNPRCLPPGNNNHWGQTWANLFAREG